MQRFKSLGVIKNVPEFDEQKLNQFENEINALKAKLSWNKQQIVDQFFNMIPDFDYEDKGQYLDGKM